MTEEQTTLARDLAVLASRRGVDLYRPGMLVRWQNDYGLMRSNRLLRRHEYRDEPSVTWQIDVRDILLGRVDGDAGGHVFSIHAPVITDAATVGCLLDVLRQSLPGKDLQVVDCAAGLTMLGVAEAATWGDTLGEAVTRALISALMRAEVSP